MPVIADISLDNLRQQYPKYYEWVQRYMAAGSVGNRFENFKTQWTGFVNDRFYFTTAGHCNGNIEYAIVYRFNAVVEFLLSFKNKKATITLVNISSSEHFYQTTQFALQRIKQEAKHHKATSMDLLIPEIELRAANHVKRYMDRASSPVPGFFCFTKTLSKYKPKKKAVVGNKQ